MQVIQHARPCPIYSHVSSDASTNDPFWNARRWLSTLPQSGGNAGQLTLSRETVVPGFLGHAEFPTKYRTRRMRHLAAHDTCDRAPAHVCAVSRPRRRNTTTKKGSPHGPTSGVCGSTSHCRQILIRLPGVAGRERGGDSGGAFLRSGGPSIHR